MQRSLAHCLVLLALVGACSEAKVQRGPKPVPRSVPALPTEPDPLSLAERLMHEASDHPEARAAVEATVARLRDDGIVFTRTRQALARPLAARYCATALTAAGLGLSLCAFTDAQAAEAGRVLSQQSFDALIPGRTLLVRRSSLLTITKPASEAARAEAERIRAQFERSTEIPGTEHAAL
jgi:hypothetical protein